MKLLAKNIAFTLVMPGTAAVYLPLWLVGGRPFASTPTRWVAILTILVGVCVYAWCVYDFASYGRGTPAPIDAPKKLVVRGLYRYTRNPMYVGVITVVLGWAMLFRSATLLLYGAVLATCFHGFVVLYEEPHLEWLFGEDYRQYCKRVGRWLTK